MNTSLAGIRNILFDLGGVIINLDRQRCVDALTALGDEKADEMLDLSVQRGTLMDLEEGKISPSDFSSACAKDRESRFGRGNRPCP